MALAKKCGVEIDNEAYMRTRYLLTWSTNEKGGIGYGAHNDVPISFKEAEKKVGRIDIKAPKYNEDEHGNGVGRLVGGAMTTTLMHMVDPMDSFSDDYVKRGVRNALCARWSCRQAHSCGSLTLQWCYTTLSLGPLMGHDDMYREAMDDIKLWLNIARCHDGSFYYEPKIDTEGNPFSRLMVTAGAILLLNSPKRNLYILGKGLNDPAVAKAAPKPTPRKAMITKPAAVSVREARTLSAQKKSALDAALMSSLVKLSSDGLLKPVPVNMSMTSASIWLKSVAADGKLTFQMVRGTKTAEFPWSNLKDSDYVTLAMLVSALKSESGDAHAMAGVYLESIGKVSDADKYFEKAGEASRKKLESLFD
jgi:hypothetical protein